MEVRPTTARRNDHKTRSLLKLARLLVFTICLSLLFLQFERGTGKPSQVLMFTAFDLLMVLALTSAFLCLTRRLYSSIFAGTAIALLTYASSWMKMRYTLIPAQASDLLDLFTAWDLVKPFALPVVVVAVACLTLFGFFYYVEKPALKTFSGRVKFGVLASLLFLVCANIAATIPTDDAAFITKNSGPKIAAFYLSILNPPELRPVTFASMKGHCCFTQTPFTTSKFTGDVKPNIVIVLQESTFNPADLLSQPPVENFLLDGSAPLKVHVRGSGTWVEEFSVLHGVPPPVYGNHFLAINKLGPQVPLPGRIAPFLISQGYDTTSVSPTGRNVLAAEVMHKSLGIHHFIGCEDITLCDKSGDWTKTPDSVYFNKVLAVLKDKSTPQFVFTATLRQHSPHFNSFPLSNHKKEVMAEYGRRLSLSSNEAEEFLSSLRELPRPTIVLMFGDHVPSDVIAAFEEKDFINPYVTFFNLYDPYGVPHAAEIMKQYPKIEAVDSAFLDVLLLKFAGFTGDYLDTKLQFMKLCVGKFCSPDAKIVGVRK